MHSFLYKGIVYRNLQANAVSMRNRMMAVFVFLIFAVVLTCSSYGAGRDGKVIICGKLEHFKNKTVFVGFYKDYLYYQKLNTTPVKTDKEGNFCFSFKWEKPWPAIIFFDEQSLAMFLRPGDSLYLLGNASSLLKTLAYSGRGARENQCLKDYTVKFSEKSEAFRKDMVNYSERDFYAANDLLYEEQIAFLEKMILREDSPEFYDFHHALIYYSYLNNLFDYSEAKGIQLNYDYMESLLENGGLDNPGALTSSIYVDFLFNYLEYISPYRVDEDNPPRNYWEFRYKLAKKEFSGDVRDLLLARILKEAFEYTYNITAVMLYNDYKNMYINTAYYLAIRDNFVEK